MTATILQFPSRPAASPEEFARRESAIRRSQLDHRAAALGVKPDEVCRECDWAKTDAGECVSAALAMHRRVVANPTSAMLTHIPVEALLSAPTDTFAPCKRERPRMQRVRLAALLGALSTLSMLWTETRKTCVAAVVDVLYAFRTYSVSTARGDIAELAAALTGWCGVRDACREHYPVDVLPALDAVHAKWMAYREVA